MYQQGQQAEICLLIPDKTVFNWAAEHGACWCH